MRVYPLFLTPACNTIHGKFLQINGYRHAFKRILEHTGTNSETKDSAQCLIHGDQGRVNKADGGDCNGIR